MGHTHEDIDQTFSVISRALRGVSRVRRDLVILNTREQFDEFLKNEVILFFQEYQKGLIRIRVQVFHTGVNVVRLGSVYDFEKLATPCINTAFHGLGHSGWDLWSDKKNPTYIIRFMRRCG